MNFEYESDQKEQDNEIYSNHDSESEYECLPEDEDLKYGSRNEDRSAEKRQNAWYEKISTKWAKEPPTRSKT